MELGLIATFGAGLLTFVSPCVLPMVPIVAANYMMSNSNSRFSRIRATLLFSFGFLLTFTLMGLSLPFVTDLLGRATSYLVIASGIVILIYGLKMAGLIFKNNGESKFSAWMSRSAYLPNLEKYFPRSLHGFIFGATFGLAWTPCVGPILGGVLAYVATKDRSIFQSITLMLAFGMGVVLPFIAIAIGGEFVSSQLLKIRRFLPKIEESTGYALVALGIFILTQSHIPSLFTEQSSPMQSSYKDQNGLMTDLNDKSLGSHKLLFFHSTTCPICQAMEAYLPSVERDCNSSSFEVVRINVDLPENQSISNKFNVRAVPTISIISPSGIELAHSVGYQSEVKMRQGINLIPKTTCASVSAPTSIPTDKNPKYDEGKSCSESTKGLTC